MERDFAKFKASEELHHKWQLDYFTTIKTKLIAKGNEWIKKGETKKGEQILKEAAKMKFVYEQTTYLNYGFCTKFKKDISFIPNTCQLDTQQCFVHRKSINK